MQLNKKKNKGPCGRPFRNLMPDLEAWQLGGLQDLGAWEPGRQLAGRWQGWQAAGRELAGSWQQGMLYVPKRNKKNNKTAISRTAFEIALKQLI